MDKKSTEEIKVYSEDGEVTVKGAWGLLKKSLVRMAIYLAVALIIVTAAFLGVRFFAGADYYVSTKIEYTFPEISSGKNPDGSVFDKDAIRSVNIIRSAVLDAGLTDKILESGHEVGDVRASITVTAVVPENEKKEYDKAETNVVLEQKTYYPTQFVVAFRDFKDYGLKSDEAAALLDEIVKEYRREFQEKHLSATIIGDTIFDMMDTAIYDYLDYCDNYAQSYASINKYLGEMVSSPAAAYRSPTNGKSFAALRNDLSQLQTRLSAVRAHIINTGAFGDIDATKGKTQTHIKQLEIEETRLNKLVADIKEQLTKFEPSTSTVIPGGSDRTTITVSYPQAYVELQQRLTGYIEELATVQANITESRQIFEIIESMTENATEADLKIVGDSLADLAEQSKTLIARLNTLSEEYAQLRVGSAGVQSNFPSTYTRKAAAFPAAMAYIIAVAVAVIAAISVTAGLSRSAKKKRERAAAVDSEKAEEEK